MKRPLSVSAFLAVAVALLASAGCVSDPPLHADRPEQEAGAGVLARIAGGVITQSEVEEAVGADLVRLQQERHQVIERGLDQVISERVLELEAKDRSLSVEELVEQEVQGKVPVPSDEAVDAFYEARKDQLQGQSKEQLADRIRDYLRQQKLQQRQAEFLEELRSKYEVTSMLEPFRMVVATENAPAVGPVDAPVTIVEFSDFECPYCARVVPTLERIKQEYPDQVRLVFRQFPLNIHPNAQKAAEASLCADDQDRFWEMHDTMFAEQKALGVEQLKQKAARLELDTEEFNECLDSGRHAERVAADLQAGIAAGVNGTPALFINGRFLNGAQPFEAIAEVIEDELARSGG